jgi:hypothetical protein
MLTLPFMNEIDCVSPGMNRDVGDQISGMTWRPKVKSTCLVCDVGLVDRENNKMLMLRQVEHQANLTGNVMINTRHVVPSIGVE